MEIIPHPVTTAESPAPTAEPAVQPASRPQPAPVRERNPLDVPVPERGVTWRAILIGTLLIPVNTYWIILVGGIWHSNHATAMSLFWNTVFCLLILVGLNLILKRYVPRIAFSQGEFITIYVMITL